MAILNIIDPSSLNSYGTLADGTPNNIFGFDPGDGDNVIKPNGCQECSGSCLMACGADCETGCSGECIDSCINGCDESCTLGCANSCSDTCKNGCGDNCTADCVMECVSTCSGLCKTECTGCSSSCENLCSNNCMHSCHTQSTTEGTTRNIPDLSNVEIPQAIKDVLDYLLNLNFKKISQFPMSPTLLDQDHLMVTVNEDKTDPLEKITMLVSDYNENTVRITTAQLMQYLNRNLKNFRMWKPFVDEEGTIQWKIVSDDTVPPPIDFRTMAIPYASETKDGIMSSGDYIKLKGLDGPSYATYDYLSSKITLNDINAQFRTDLDNRFAPLTHYHNQYALSDTLNNNYYTKTVIDGFLSGKSDTTHNHDAVYLKKTDAASTYLKKTDFNTTIAKYTNTVAMNALLDKKLDKTVAASTYVSIANALTQIPLASRDSNGLMTNTQWSIINGLDNKFNGVNTKIENTATEIIAQIPTKVSQLANDSKYLVVDTLPIATNTKLGVVKIPRDSKISVDSNGAIDTKLFGTTNLLRNSSFLSEGKYWSAIGWDDAFGSGTDMSRDVSYTISNPYSVSPDVAIAAANDLKLCQLIQFESTGHLAFRMEAKDIGSVRITIETYNSDSTFMIESELSWSSEDWTYVSAIIDIPESTKINTYVFSIYLNAGQTSIRRMMLQTGLYNTGWVPNALDGNSITQLQINTAAVGRLGVVMPDNSSIFINENGVISARDVIKDYTIATNYTYSSSKIEDRIPEYIRTEGILTTNNIRLYDSAITEDWYDGSWGCAIVADKTNDHFILGVTNVGDEMGDYRTDVIPMRIDLTTGICDINGNAMTATNAVNDKNGNDITTTYVTVAELNSVLTQIMTAIENLGK